MIRSQSGAEGRIYSGRLIGSIQAPPDNVFLEGSIQPRPDNVFLGGGSAGEARLTRAPGRETPVELDLLQVEKVH